MKSFSSYRHNILIAIRRASFRPSLNLAMLIYLSVWAGWASSCQSLHETSFLTPVVRQRTVHLHGRITNETGNHAGKPITLQFFLAHPVTMEAVTQEVTTDSLGQYSVTMEVETNPVMVGLHTNLQPEKAMVVELKQRKNLELDICYTRNNGVRISQNQNSGLTEKDMLAGSSLIVAALEQPYEMIPLYDQPFETFLAHREKIIREKTSLITQDTAISEPFKTYLKAVVRSSCYQAYAFDYPAEIERNYYNLHPGETQADAGYSVAPPPLPYYGFLKHLQLDNKLQLCNPAFVQVQEWLLLNDTLAIPPIQDTPIPTWQTAVKNRLSALLGFGEGTYYDLLTANAYARQLNMEAVPLSATQKTHIHAYFKGGEIEKILLALNEKTERYLSFREPLTVREEATELNADQVWADILERNRGKIILIDFWATWCSPCLMGMRDMKKMQLPDNINKEIVHVYLAEGSSPHNLWKKYLPEFGGQHYYLNAAAYNQLMKRYGFASIPSYVLVGKDGEVKQTFGGYPGKEEMEKLINKMYTTGHPFIIRDKDNEPRTLTLTIENKKYEQLALVTHVRQKDNRHNALEIPGTSADGYTWNFTVPDSIYRLSGEYFVRTHPFDFKRNEEKALTFSALAQSNKKFNSIKLHNNHTRLKGRYAYSVSDTCRNGMGYLLTDTFIINPILTCDVIDLKLQKPKHRSELEMRLAHPHWENATIRNYTMAKRLKLVKRYPYSTYLFEALPTLSKSIGQEDANRLFDAFSEEMRQSWTGKRIHKFINSNP